MVKFPHALNPVLESCLYNKKKGEEETELLTECQGDREREINKSPLSEEQVFFF